MRMQEIGRIKLLQIQRASLKAGEKPHRYYDPSPLLIVETLLLTARGTLGVTKQGEHLIDVHNADHPTTGYLGSNGISLGFTPHYQAMRTQFGDHLSDGRAGENILVETETAFTLDDLAKGVIIQRNATGATIFLTDVVVAAPCVEFSHYAAQKLEPLTNEQLKQTLQFLNHGRRGFYATLATTYLQMRVPLQVGDKVFLPDEA